MGKKVTLSSAIAITWKSLALSLVGIFLVHPYQSNLCGRSGLHFGRSIPTVTKLRLSPSGFSDSVRLFASPSWDQTCMDLQIWRSKQVDPFVSYASLLAFLWDLRRLLPPSDKVASKNF
jgi:hypothetical protein